MIPLLVRTCAYSSVLFECVDLKPKEWEKLKEKNNWNEVDLRDSRYNVVIHMVSAAIGAEDFYRLDNNTTRTEGIEIARELDKLTAQVQLLLQ